jgi:hypothetical protein
MSSRNVFRLLTLASVMLCGACSIAPGPTPRLQPLADIPIEIRNRLPTVDVRVSGQPFKLFLDLGGFQALALTTSELTRVGVRFHDSSDQFRNSKGQILTSRRFLAEGVFLDSFYLGDLEGGESIFGDSVPPDRNGHIGMPVLGHYLLVVDYPQKRVRLYGSGNTAALKGECGEKTFPVRLEKGIAVSTGSTEHGDRLFIWDTGSTDNVIRPSVVPPQKAAGRRIDDGPPVVTLERLELGGHDIGPQQFRLVPFGAPDVDAYLGADLFATRRVCLDVRKGIGAIR